MTKRSWLGFLLAPLVAPCLYQLALILFEYESVPDLYTLAVKAFLPLLIIALPISYAAMLFIGIPLVWFLRRINFLHFISLTFIAAIFGSLIMAYVYGPQSWTDVGLQDYFWYPILGGFLGFSVAAVYALITGITIRPGRQRQTASRNTAPR